MTDRKKSKATSSGSKIQEQFISNLKQVLPPGFGLAEEIADILDVSLDSAYRRIRGETDLTIDEIHKITNKYKLSVDEVFSNQNDTVTFAYTKLTDSVVNFEIYLTRIAKHLNLVNKFENKKIFYVAEEIPMFYSFFSKKLSDFKLFYWQRSVLNISEYQKLKFEYGIVPKNLLAIAQTTYEEYQKIPSVEIWTEETVFTGLRQITFYFYSGIITKTQALELLDEYRQMIVMVQKNAESARKNSSDKNETYFLYMSEVVLGTNCIYAIMGDSKFSYISFNSINSLTTNNPEFCEETEHWIKNLEKKSTLISGVSEKQRYQFFSTVFNNVDECIEKISKS